MTSHSVTAHVRKKPALAGNMEIIKSRDSKGFPYTRLVSFTYHTERWREYIAPDGKLLLRIEFSPNGARARVKGSFDAVRAINPDMMPHATEQSIVARKTWLPFSHMSGVPSDAEDEARYTQLVFIVEASGFDMLNAEEQAFLRDNAHRFAVVKVN